MTLALHELAWTARARCAGEPSDLFYADRHTPAAVRAAALACCNDGPTCPVRRDCLAFAIVNHETAGIWGGTSARQRRPLANARCPGCRISLPRPLVAAMVRDARQHARCPHCAAMMEVVPPWESPHRNSWVTGSGRRT